MSSTDRKCWLHGEPRPPPPNATPIQPPPPPPYRPFLNKWVKPLTVIKQRNGKFVYHRQTPDIDKPFKQCMHDPSTPSKRRFIWEGSCAPINPDEPPIHPEHQPPYLRTSTPHLQNGTDAHQEHTFKVQTGTNPTTHKVRTPASDNSHAKTQRQSHGSQNC